MALPVARRDHLEPRNLHELPFQRRGHVVRHRFRRSSRITHLHLDYGIVHGRKVADRQPQVSEQTKQDHRYRQRDGHHRPSNKKLRKVHFEPFSEAPGCAVPPGAAALVSMRTGPPGRTNNCPATTTRSPAFNPLATTTSLPCRWPNVTGRNSAVSSFLITYTKGPCWLICVAWLGTRIACFSVANTSFTFTNCPGQKRWSGFETVARKFTVPVLFCTELSRNSTRPGRAAVSGSPGSRTIAFSTPWLICFCTSGRSRSVIVKFA